MENGRRKAVLEKKTPVHTKLEKNEQIARKFRMKNDNSNIFPIYSQLLTRKDREKLLCQHSKVLWLVGLSGAGKSTIANALDRKLYERQFKTFMLDGDNLRHGLNANLGFSESDRIENLRRAGHIAKIVHESGVIVIASFITPTHAAQVMLREIMPENLLIVHLDCPLSVCEHRDVKGLYAKARKGELKNFTGIDSPFEPPKECWLRLNTDTYTIEEAVEKIFDKLLPLIDFSEEN
jgi:adenylylsulfate kinase